MTRDLEQIEAGEHAAALEHLFSLPNDATRCKTRRRTVRHPAGPRKTKWGHLLTGSVECVDNFFAIRPLDFGETIRKFFPGVGLHINAGPRGKSGAAYAFARQLASVLADAARTVDPAAWHWDLEILRLGKHRPCRGPYAAHGKRADNNCRLYQQPTKRSTLFREQFPNRPDRFHQLPFRDTGQSIGRLVLTAGKSVNDIVLSPGLLMTVCRAKDDRRFVGYDDCLPRPSFTPAITRLFRWFTPRQHTKSGGRP
jgi:hypothetical protein